VSRNTSDPLYPSVTTGSGAANWAGSWRWQSMDTGIATNTLNKTFDAANPVASVTACIGYREATLSSTSKQYKIREYIKLTYDCSNITGFVSLAVYRRNYNNTPTGSTTEAKYIGVGRWEKITTTNQTGTLSLRLPTAWNEFDNKYGITTGLNLTKGYLGANGYPTGLANDNTTNGESRYNIPLLTNFAGVQLLLIVTTSTGASTKGLLIKGQLLNGTGQIDFLTTSNGFAVKPVVIEMQSSTDTNAVYIKDADFPVAGYKRKLSEARTTQVVRQDLVVVDSENPNIIAYQRPTVWDYTLVDSYPGTGTV
jgi:hypothetical protein